MAYEITGSTIGVFKAAADYRLLQYRFVYQSSATEVTVRASALDVLGVLQNHPNIGEMATVWTTPNTSKVTAGAAVTAGAKVMSDSTGRAITATSTNKAIGYALTAAAAAGDVISVQLRDLGTQ